jgi:spermidine dehydrogenase
MSDSKDLGLGVSIKRRDFVGGVAAALGFLGAGRAGAGESAAGTSPSAGSAAEDAAHYPPLRSGLRGQYPGSFEAAHQVRDNFFAGNLEAADTSEHYDLVVVGAGISGLSAAHFFRKALGTDRTILILDNHDDFGGHAKRNEFRIDGRTFLSFGGTMSIETPFPYSFTANALLAELGVDPKSFARYERPELFKGLGAAVFFNAEDFGVDRLVGGYEQKPWDEFFAQAPLDPDVRDDLIRIHAQPIDYLPGLNPAEKASRLKQMSYATFLTEHAGLREDSLAYFRGQGFRNNMRVDTCPAFVAWRLGAAGFSGMSISAEPLVHADYFHFPDGNASIARLLVNRLISQSFDALHDQESIVLAPLNYDALDLEESPVRIRLNATAVRVEHIGVPDRATERAVRVVYIQDGQLRQVTSANAVLACFNNIVPFLVPTLPEAQREALHYASKVPMMYTSVLIRNWRPWKELGVREIQAPNGFYTYVQLDTALRIGGYESVGTPDEPVIVQMFKNWNKPGLPRKEQNRAGRADMLAASFESLELETRSQLNRMLGAGGFDAKRDILALTINRWPHGYAYTYDTLGDPDIPDAERPHVLGRQPFGRITIANADSGAAAFTNVAIDQAERAVQECLASRGMI